MGYHRAGFEVVGVDIKPQPRYPFEFHQADALEFPLSGFDVIHASPPCQKFSRATNIHNGKPYQKNHPDLIDAIRQRLSATERPYIIENVPEAPLTSCVTLCGTMFEGLRVYRHRNFETWPIVLLPPYCCNHKYRLPPNKGHYHTLDEYDFITCVGHNFSAESGRIAMGIGWMTRDELAEAIPPAYTEWIGRKFLEYLATNQDSGLGSQG